MIEFDLPAQHDTLPGIKAPVENAALFGHADKAGLLARAYQGGRLHHALLFEGPSGIGKAGMAFHLAQHLIAFPSSIDAPETLALLDRNGSDFRQLALGTHLQALHLTRPFDPKTEKFKTKLTVDEIRRINHFLSRTSPGDGYRVVIIDPVNDMNDSAANALLKNLEEPPKRTLFVLVAHSAGRILPTIRSRCQVMRFEALSDENLKLAAAAATASTPVAADILNRVVSLAEGSVRRALMLASFGGLEVTETADRLVANTRFDTDLAAKLGDAMMAREADIQFQLLTDHLLQKIARATRQHVQSNDLQRANTMARFHAETQRNLAAAQAFNLDRKQTVFGLIANLNAKAHSGLV